MQDITASQFLSIYGAIFIAIVQRGATSTRKCVNPAPSKDPRGRAIKKATLRQKFASRIWWPVVDGRSAHFGDEKLT